MCSEWYCDGKHTYDTRHLGADEQSKRPERDPFPVGTPEWADWWEQKYGRENLDSVTVANLDGMRHGAPMYGARDPLPEQCTKKHVDPETQHLLDIIDRQAAALARIAKGPWVEAREIAREHLENS